MNGNTERVYFTLSEVCIPGKIKKVMTINKADD